MLYPDEVPNGNRKQSQAEATLWLLVSDINLQISRNGDSVQIEPRLAMVLCIGCLK